MTKLKLVSSADRVLKVKPKKRKSPWNRIHDRLPSQRKSILVKYRFGRTEYEGKLRWWTACATGEYFAGKFNFHDPHLSHWLKGEDSFVVVTDWQYIRLNNREGQQ